MFRLAPAGVNRSNALHERLAARNVGASALDGKAVGLVALHYEGDIARQVRVILELPDNVWDDLAGWADDLLDEDSFQGEEV